MLHGFVRNRLPTAADPDILSRFSSYPRGALRLGIEPRPLASPQVHGTTTGNPFKGRSPAGLELSHLVRPQSSSPPTTVHEIE